MRAQDPGTELAKAKLASPRALTHERCGAQDRASSIAELTRTTHRDCQGYAVHDAGGKPRPARRVGAEEGARRRGNTRFGEGPAYSRGAQVSPAGRATITHLFNGMRRHHRHRTSPPAPPRQPSRRSATPSTPTPSLRDIGHGLGMSCSSPAMAAAGMADGRYSAGIIVKDGVRVGKHHLWRYRTSCVRVMRRILDRRIVHAGARSGEPRFWDKSTRWRPSHDRRDRLTTLAVRRRRRGVAVVCVRGKRKRSARQRWGGRVHYGSNLASSVHAVGRRWRYQVRLPGSARIPARPAAPMPGVWRMCRMAPRWGSRTPSRIGVLAARLHV